MGSKASTATTKTVGTPAPAAANAKSKWARMNMILGITLVAAGIFLDTAGFYLEAIVAASGVLVTMAGLVGILIVLIKGMPARANLLGLFAVVLGVLLTVHDFIFAAFATFAHATLGVVMVLVGLFQILGRSKLVDMLGQAEAT